MYKVSAILNIILLLSIPVIFHRVMLLLLRPDDAAVWFEEIWECLLEDEGVC